MGWTSRKANGSYLQMLMMEGIPGGLNIVSNRKWSLKSLLRILFSDFCEFTSLTFSLLKIFIFYDFFSSQLMRALNSDLFIAHC